VPTRAYDITRPQQVRALASGIRQEIVDAAEVLGPCSIADLAAALGRPADGLYYHVRLLMRVGLLVEAGRRAAGRRQEVLLRTPGRPMRLKAAIDQAQSLSEINRAMMRLGARDFRRAIESPEARTIGPARNVYSGRTTGRLTPAQVRRIGVLIRQIQEEFAREPAPGARLHAVTLMLVPLCRRSSRRASQGDTQ